MKVITEKERPIGTTYYSTHEVFYTESIKRETEKAFLVSLYHDYWGEVDKWVPKSKCLRYIIDEKTSQYFIPNFFVKWGDPPELNGWGEKHWTPDSEAFTDDTGYIGNKRYIRRKN